MNDMYIKTIKEAGGLPSKDREIAQLLWSKNIEVAFTEDRIMLNNLSDINLGCFFVLRMKYPFMRYDIKNKTCYFERKDLEEIKKIIENFATQDTLRYLSAKELTDRYNETHKDKPLEIQDILKMTGKENLYIPEEDRIYEDTVFLKWHVNYLEKTTKGVHSRDIQSLKELNQETDKLYDIVVFGGASIDKMYYQTSDGSYHDEPDMLAGGGKGANQAVAASRAGAKTMIITRVGSDKLGEAIINNLKLNGVDTSNIEMVKGTPNDVTKVFINNIDADNEMEKESTGAIDSFTPDMIDIYAKQLLNAKYVVAQMKAPKEVSIKLINFCHTNNIPIVVTPCRPEKLTLTADPLNEDLINKITYITCNRKECKTIFGTDDVEECVTKYPNKLIVTLGADGVIFHDGTKLVHIPAVKIDRVIDTIGAGDTFNGNLCALLARGYSLEKSIYMAQFASAIKIGIRTAQDGMPYREELEKYINEYENGKDITKEDIPVEKLKPIPLEFIKEEYHKSKH